MSVYQYKVIFYVDGRKTEQIVSARNYQEARDIVNSQYAGHNVTIFNVIAL